MADITIVERTEPFTLDEVFDFIDDTNISKRDAHELKSRIADAVRGIRAKAIDEFAGRLRENTVKTLGGNCIMISQNRFDEIVEQMKGEQNE